MAYDAGRQRVVLFGGATPSGETNDTWEWDGASWSPRSPSVSPPARSGAVMFYDAALSAIVLFGGDRFSSRPLLNDTWIWSGASWTQLTPSHSPPVRRGACGAFDSARGVGVVFSGYCQANDTWGWTGSDWQRLSTPTMPGSRLAASMAYDSQRRCAVMIGGFYWNRGTAIAAADTWVWNGASWKSIPTLPASEVLGNAPMAFDSQRGVMVLFARLTASASGSEGRQLGSGH